MDLINFYNGFQEQQKLKREKATAEFALKILGWSLGATFASLVIIGLLN